jgi:hypothetical protein
MEQESKPEESHILGNPSSNSSVQPTPETANPTTQQDASIVAATVASLLSAHGRSDSMNPMAETEHPNKLELVVR